MFEVGCTVLYGSEGVCTVKDITNREIGGANREYYVLEPVYQKKTTVFVPTDNKTLSSKMRDIVTADEIAAILKDAPKSSVSWISDDSKRKETYKEVLERGDCCELIRMCHMLRQRRTELSEQRRKLGAVDGNFLKTAEKMVFDEFASALDISPDQVLTFINDYYEAKV